LKVKIRKLLFVFGISLLAFSSCSPSLKISEYAVTEKSLFLGNKIGALPLKEYDVKILRIKRGRNFMRYFDDNTKLQVNDTLFLLGTSTQLEKIYRYFDKKE